MIGKRREIGARRTPPTDQILAGERGQQKKPAERLPRLVELAEGLRLAARLRAEDFPAARHVYGERLRVRSVAIAVRRPIGLGLSCVGFPRVKKRKRGFSRAPRRAPV